ncbi:hypothetical protein GCM10011529_08210 [Polymorphobacter glacialis]|uniref:NadR/Ttd14 AAA domain-containing protein n=1 Tax=Sandarakinorhabdus glacialis TaxID=1614636 RepID=A0A917E622_9SPHN|nr:ATP-binding protein [Polymorphobacter glacialis]GGE04201.1 hypothetical protein GCM10011529_08210 [Polymorphobacter glacialis]
MIRICLTGVESTGKSTLSWELAKHFGAGGAGAGDSQRVAVVMTELGRSWAELHGTDFNIAALREIAAGHIVARDELIATGPDLLIEDTDIVMTSAWAQMLHGTRDPLLTAVPATANLYLLFAPDTPWIDDGTRMFAGPKRARFHAIVADELALRGIRPVNISGPWQQRFDTAVAAIAPLLRSRGSLA